MLLRNVLNAIGMLVSAPITARTAAKTDAALADAYAAINRTKCNPARPPANRESAAVHFINLMQGYLKRNDSWSCRFPKTKAAGICIQTAADGRVRTFSWREHNGDARHRYRTLLQYRSNSGQTGIINTGALSSSKVEQLISDHLGRYGTVYFLLTESRSSGALEQAIYLLHFEHDVLCPLDIIRTPHLTGSLHYRHPPMPVDALRHSFTYDHLKKTISLPDATETAGSPIDDKPIPHRIRYRFDGTYFVRHP